MENTACNHVIKVNIVICAKGGELRLHRQTFLEFPNFLALDFATTQFFYPTCLKNVIK